MKDDHKAKSRGHFAIVACTLVLLPVLYVLSLGPAYWLYRHRYLSESQMDWACMPIDCIGEKWPAGSTPVYWYMNLW